VYEKRPSDARQLAGRGGVTYACWKCGGVHGAKRRNALKVRNVREYAQ
jgi:hypothetical protein